MNIAQTKQILSYIWSTHPSAPKYSDEGKTRIIASYFRVLYKYSVNDVLAAIDAVCADKPTFIPSAYEIEAKCEKSVYVDAYLPRKYHELAKSLHHHEQIRAALEPKYAEAFAARARILHDTIFALLDDEQREALRAQIEPYEIIISEYTDAAESCRDLKKQMEDLYIQATWKAYDDYDREQAQLAQHDLTAIDNRMNALEG